MKQVSVTYSALWSTTLEVPDDFDPTIDNLIQLAIDNERDFDFTDGGARWGIDSFDFGKSTIWVGNNIHSVEP